MGKSAKTSTGEVMSMTGFGRSSWSGDEGTATVSARSVNHRYLDVSVRLPETLWEIEPRIRAMVAERARRGKFEVSVRVSRSEGYGAVLKIDHDLAVDAVRRLEGIAATLEIDARPDLRTILAIPGVASLETSEGEDVWQRVVIDALAEALGNLVEMRRNEGAAIAANLRDLIGGCRTEKERLSALRDDARAELESSFRQRLSDLAESVDIEIREERLAQELAMMAEKADIAEELVRIDSHLDQMEGALSEGTDVGRRLDFLCQELNREVNTIGSKARSAPLRSAVVELKTLVERLREQVQNVE